MEIIVRKYLADNGKALPIVSGAHNVFYSSAERNSLYFTVRKYPYKDMLNIAAEQERGSVKPLEGCIRATFNTQGVRLAFRFRYRVDTPEVCQAGEVSRHSIVVKDQIYGMEAE